MSDQEHSSHHNHAHTGPIRTPKQLLMTCFYAFVVPVIVIIALVYYVTSSVQPSTTAEQGSVGGVTVDEKAQAVERRIQKVGMVEIRDANREPKSGEEVFKAQCSACHATGVAGAPKFGNAAAWGPRLKAGYAGLLNSALKGKGAMSPQGGGDFDDIEIGRAVVYMANAGGGKFPIPQKGDAAPAK